MRYLIVASILLGLASFAAHGQADKKTPDSSVANLFQDLSYPDAVARAKKDKKVVMVEFALSTCGRCKALDAQTLPDKQVQQFIRGKTVAIKITLDKERDKVTRDLGKFIMGTVSTPTILFISPEGKELGRTVGFVSAKDFLDQARKFVK